MTTNLVGASPPRFAPSNGEFFGRVRFRFTVLGSAEPQGSARAFVIAGRARITSDNKDLKVWRQDVARLALLAMREAHLEKVLRPAGVELHCTFYFARPMSLKASIVEKTTKPDEDKLRRGIADALTGIVYEDDAQIVGGSQWKLFGDPPRAEITVVWR